jgi:hypothetical protein
VSYGYGDDEFEDENGEVEKAGGGIDDGYESDAGSDDVSEQKKESLKTTYTSEVIPTTVHISGTSVSTSGERIAKDMAELKKMTEGTQDPPRQSVAEMFVKKSCRKLADGGDSMDGGLERPSRANGESDAGLGRACDKFSIILASPAPGCENMMD